jgi:hypothetical protein
MRIHSASMRIHSASCDLFFGHLMQLTA